MEEPKKPEDKSSEPHKDQEHDSDYTWHPSHEPHIPFDDWQDASEDLPGEGTVHSY